MKLPISEEYGELKLSKARIGKMCSGYAGVASRKRGLL